MSAKHAETIVESGTEIFNPAQQAQEVPEERPQDAAQRGGDRSLCGEHRPKGILQNPVVEPDWTATVRLSISSPR
jgi:ParB family transcriptional regulator, chromosome partitioning protein